MMPPPVLDEQTIRDQIQEFEALRVAAKSEGITHRVDFYTERIAHLRAALEKIIAPGGELGESLAASGVAPDRLRELCRKIFKTVSDALESFQDKPDDVPVYWSVAMTFGEARELMALLFPPPKIAGQGVRSGKGF